MYEGAFKEVVPLPFEDESIRDYISMRDDRQNALKKAKQQLKSLRFAIPADQLNFNAYYAEVCRLEEMVQRFDQQLDEYSKEDRYQEKVAHVRCFGGIDTHRAMATVCEIGDFSRFSTLKEFASYLGLSPGQHASGGKAQMTGITKAGNSHLRRLCVKSANAMARISIFQKSKRLQARQIGNPVALIAYADRETSRIRYKYKKMLQEGKNCNLVKAACAREIACFVWEMMTDKIYGELV